FADRLGCRGTDRRQKAHEELSPAVLRPSRLEGVPEEVERNILKFPGPVIVLAIHNPGLHRMKLQTARCKSTPDGIQHHTCLPLTRAMDDGIVRIALELNVRILSSHPD